MRLKGSKKEVGEQLRAELPVEERILRQAQDKKGKKKKERNEGSRWAAVGLLVVTVILATLFWLKGSADWDGWWRGIKNWWGNLGGETVHVVE